MPELEGLEDLRTKRGVRFERRNTACLEPGDTIRLRMATGFVFLVVKVPGESGTVDVTWCEKGDNPKVQYLGERPLRDCYTDNQLFESLDERVLGVELL